MRLITFVSGNQLRLGALRNHGHRTLVFDLQSLDPRLPADILAFLAGGSEMRAMAESVLATAPIEKGLELGSLTLKAPIPCPGKIICIGQNYREHAAETNASIPPHPVIFSKFANSVIGPGEPIVIPEAVEKPDYEGELAVVIGRRGRNIPEAEALDYVAGYTCLNDVSARDWQMRTSQWTIGKTPDTFCPIGPALVTADEVPDPHDLTVRTVVSGEVLQEGHTGDMIFSIAHLIWDMSRVMTLEPGDVIATGTPSGVGMARKPPRWLRPGDVVRVEISGVGVLENPVVAESDYQEGMA